MIGKSLAALCLLCSTAFGIVTHVDLSQYDLTGTFDLDPILASEASAMAYNFDTDTFFVLGDEGDAVVEVDRMGVTLSSMTLTNFDDTEGMTYIGNGQFVLTEERLQDLFKSTYVSGGTVDRSSLKSVSLGPTIGNIGIEGVSFEPSTGKYYAVKEKQLQAAYEVDADFDAGTAAVMDLFTPNLGVTDLSDIQVLSIVPSLAGSMDRDNLLIISQESQKLLEVDRDGNVLSMFDLTGLGGDLEGVTIDFDGNIYIVGEAPKLFVLTPRASLTPEPASGLVGFAALAGLRLRKRRAMKTC